jgi:hypothetical protein
MLTKQDYKNLLNIVMNSRITGNDAVYVAGLIQKLSILSSSEMDIKNTKITSNDLIKKNENNIRKDKKSK